MLIDRIGSEHFLPLRTAAITQPLDRVLRVHFAPARHSKRGWRGLLQLAMQLPQQPYPLPHHHSYSSCSPHSSRILPIFFDRWNHPQFMLHMLWGPLLFISWADFLVECYSSWRPTRGTVTSISSVPTSPFSSVVYKVRHIHHLPLCFSNSQHLRQDSPHLPSLPCSLAYCMQLSLQQSQSRRSPLSPRLSRRCPRLLHLSLLPHLQAELWGGRSHSPLLEGGGPLSMPSSRCLHLSRIVHSLQPSSGSPSKGLWISHSLLAPHPPLPIPPLLEDHLQ